MSAPEVIVITSPGSQRQQLAVQHLQGRGLVPKISPAVFIEGEVSACRHYNEAQRNFVLGYDMTKGEVGCFLAHRQAWELTVQLGVNCLILEDDARLDPSLPALLPQISATIQDTNFIIRLYSFRHPKGKLWHAINETVFITRPLIAGSSAVAYLLTPKAAQALIAASETFWLAVDEYMDDEMAHGCAIMQVTPELIYHEDGGASLIGSRTKPKLKFWAKIRREALRIIKNIRQAIHREGVLWKLGIRFRKSIRS